jgi:hypothetical protein
LYESKSIIAFKILTTVFLFISLFFLTSLEEK